MPQLTPQVSEVLEKALALSTQDRGLIIDRLIESLDDEPAEEGVEAAWSDEIKRRCRRGGYLGRASVCRFLRGADAARKIRGRLRRVSPKRTSLAAATERLGSAADGATLRNGRLKSGTVHADRRTMDISSIALQGFAQAEAQLDAAVSGLANANANSAGGANVDTVDIASQIVAMNAAQIQAQVSISALKTADQLQKTVLNLVA